MRIVITTDGRDRIAVVDFGDGELRRLDLQAVNAYLGDALLVGCYEADDVAGYAVVRRREPRDTDERLETVRGPIRCQVEGRGLPWGGTSAAWPERERAAVEGALQAARMAVEAYRNGPPSRRDQALDGLDFWLDRVQQVREEWAARG